MSQFKYLGAEICPIGDQAPVRPLNLAFVLDEAFVVACVFPLCDGVMFVASG